MCMLTSIFVQWEMYLNCEFGENIDHKKYANTNVCSSIGKLYVCIYIRTYIYEISLTENTDILFIF